MRVILLAAVAAAAACSVDKKQSVEPDAGVDSGPPDGGSDEQPPETTITAGPDEFSRVGAATFQFSSDDPAATFECSIDGETPVVCRSPYTRTLGDGGHSFAVRAIDHTGNPDATPAERVWTIDTVPPETQLTMTPPVADNSVDVMFEFRSAEPNAVFDCSLDGGTYTACASGATFGPLGDGAHSFAVRARDRAGNVDASPAIYAWSIDTSTPDTQLLSVPPEASGSTSATFTFVSPDAGSGATFQCSLDGGAMAACTSPRTVGPLSEGNHVFSVRVRDAVGNFDPTPATKTWRVDLTAPTTTIVAGPSGMTRVASASFTFTSNEADVTYACSDDGGPFVACTSPHNLTMLAQGAHTFTVRATDTAGHTDASPATRTWTVDTVPPDIVFTASPPEGGVVGPRVGFTFTVSDGTIACSLDAAAFAACTSPEAFNLPAGPHQFRVRATDGAGNISTELRTFTVACAAPDVAGAAGLLHLDDTGQTLANAVAGGAGATLGDDITVEPGDPVPVPGRFGGALALTAAESDHVSWPAALAAMPALTLELWAQPDAPAGARDALVSGDGRVALRVTAASPTTVRFSITVIEAGPGGKVRTATSAAVAAGQWHHVLASLAEPTLRLWVDGVRTEVGMVDAGGVDLTAVTLGGAGATAYSGTLDEVWVAQTPITADEAALARYCPL